MLHDTEIKGMSLALVCEDQIVIRKNSITHINSQTLQEIGNLIRFVQSSDMFPVEYFAGDRMAYRKIGIVDIATYIKLAFISKSNIVIKQEHIDQGFRLGSDVVAVYCFDSEVLGMLRIAFIFGMHPGIEFLVHGKRKRRIIRSQKNPNLRNIDKPLNIGICAMFFQIGIQCIQFAESILQFLLIKVLSGKGLRQAAIRVRNINVYFFIPLALRNKPFVILPAFGPAGAVDQVSFRCP